MDRPGPRLNRCHLWKGTHSKSAARQKCRSPPTLARSSKRSPSRRIDRRKTPDTAFATQGGVLRLRTTSVSSNTACTVSNQRVSLWQILGAIASASRRPLPEPRSKRGYGDLPRHRAQWSILRLMEETKEERDRAQRELQDPTTRELGELRLRLVHDRTNSSIC